MKSKFFQKLLFPFFLIGIMFERCIRQFAINCTDVIGGSSEAEPCPVNLERIKRVAFAHKDADVSAFQDAVEATYQANLLTLSNWTTAIGLATIDRISMTPNLDAFELPQDDKTDITNTRGDRRITSQKNGRIMILTFEASDNDTHQNFRGHENKPVKFIIIDEDANFRYRKHVDVNTDPFFRGDVTFVSDIGIVDGEPNRFTVEVFVPSEEMDNFEDATLSGLLTV